MKIIAGIIGSSKKKEHKELLDIMDKMDDEKLLDIIDDIYIDDEEYNDMKNDMDIDDIKGYFADTFFDMGMTFEDAKNALISYN